MAGNYKVRNTDGGKKVWMTWKRVDISEGSLYRRFGFWRMGSNRESG